MSSVGDTSLWRMFHSWTKLAVGGLGRSRAIMRHSGMAVGRRVRKLARPQSLWLEVCATREPRLGGAGRFFRGGDSLAQGGMIVWSGAGFPQEQKADDTFWRCGLATASAAPAPRPSLPALASPAFRRALARGPSWAGKPAGLHTWPCSACLPHLPPPSTSYSPPRPAPAMELGALGVWL